MTKTLRSPEHIYLCEQLVKARREAGLTQAQLAEKLGKPQSYVAKVETRERRLDIVEFVKWMNASKADSTISEVAKGILIINSWD